MGDSKQTQQHGHFISSDVIEAIRHASFNNFKEFHKRFLIHEMEYQTFAKAMRKEQVSEYVHNDIVIAAKSLNLLDENSTIEDPTSSLMVYFAILRELFSHIDYYWRNPWHKNMNPVIEVFKKYRHLVGIEPMADEEGRKL